MLHIVCQNSHHLDAKSRSHRITIKKESCVQIRLRVEPFTFVFSISECSRTVFQGFKEFISKSIHVYKNQSKLTSLMT